MKQEKVRKLNKGFTLTELIIVIVIIGILAAVLIPSLSSYINKAKKSAAEQDALSIYQEYIAEADNDIYDDVAHCNYIIEIDGGKFYCIIENGALQSDKTVDEKDFKSKYTNYAPDPDTREINITEASGVENCYLLIRKASTINIKTVDKNLVITVEGIYKASEK